MHVEQLGKLERRLSIRLPVADIDKEVDARLRRLSRTMKMAGFRPGKVPLKIVAQQYGFQVRSDVLSDQVGRAFSQAVQENQLRVAGSPSIAPHTGEPVPDGTLAFDATFEVYPEVTIGALGTIAIERPVTPVGDAEIDKTLEILRKQRVHYHPKGEAGEHGDGGAPVAAASDRVTIDFIGTIEGVPFEGGSATDFAFVLGENSMLPAFESGVEGAKVGDVRVLSVTFPEDYQGRDVAGKTAEFTVTVKKIEWAHRPEVDAAFAQSLGVPDGDLEKMRADIRSNLEREVKKRIQARLKDKVMDALLAVCELELPKALVDNEIQRQSELTRQDLRQRGMKVDDAPFPPDIFKPRAERRVRLGLILAELVREHSLQPKPAQIKAHIEELADSYENPAEVVRWYYADKSRLSEVEALVLEENVVDFVVAQAQVTDTSVPFDELMGQTTA